MKPAPKSESLFRALLDDDESAAQASFIDLCRNSPAFRHWLWEDFAHDAKVRTKVAQVVDSGSASPANGTRWFAALADEDRSWREERHRLQKEMPDAPRLYGGLTWAEIESLVRHYQAGSLDLGVFLLAHDWRRAGDSAAASPVLARAAIEFIDAVVRSQRPRLLRHFAKALRLLESYGQKSKRRAAVGYSDWWKLQTLLFMLRHPRPSYRPRDLRSHLAALGLEASVKDIRRFCTRHNIRRDMRAGRPRKRLSAQATC